MVMCPIVSWRMALLTLYLTHKASTYSATTFYFLISAHFPSYFKSSIFTNSISHLSCNFIITLPNAGDFPFLPNPLSKLIRPFGIYIFPATSCIDSINLFVVINSIGNNIYIYSVIGFISFNSLFQKFVFYCKRWINPYLFIFCPIR